MKIYGIKPWREKFSWGEMDVLALGEKGRGRECVIVPFHAEFAPEGSDYEIEETKTGNPKIIRTGQPTQGWIARIKCEGAYTRGTSGSAYVHNEDKESVKVIAKGYGAYGDAGRIGNWDDYLVVIKAFPCRVFVRPSGGAHKVARYWLVFQPDRVYRIGTDEVAAFGEATGILLPEGESPHVTLYKCPAAECVDYCQFNESDWRFHVNYNHKDAPPTPILSPTLLISF